jgi:uncharacterized protein YaeQ
MASMLLLLVFRTASIRIVFRSNLAEDGLDAPAVGLEDGLEVLESVLTLGLPDNRQLQPSLHQSVFLKGTFMRDF